MARGLFITLEGPEGSGKTTQSARLVARLAADGIPAIGVREPGGTRTGEAIRRVLQHDAAGEPIHPETELLLFAACRAQLVRTVIEPALAGGACVVCDRFIDSTTAYQGYGRGLDLSTVEQVNRLAAGAAWPDLTLVLDVAAATGLLRLRHRLSSHAGGDRIERESVEFHERVRSGYLRLASECPSRFRVVGTERDADAVHAEIWGHVCGLLTAHGVKASRATAARPATDPLAQGVRP